MRKRRETLPELGPRRTRTALTVTWTDAVRLASFASVAVYVRVWRPRSCLTVRAASNLPVPSVGIGYTKVPSRVRFAVLDGVNPVPTKLTLSPER